LLSFEVGQLSGLLRRGGWLPLSKCSRQSSRRRRPEKQLNEQAGNKKMYPLRNSQPAKVSEVGDMKGEAGKRAKAAVNSKY